MTKTTNRNSNKKIGENVDDGPPFDYSSDEDSRQSKKEPPAKDGKVTSNVKLTVRQGWPYSCGSAALLCVAIELGVPTISSSFGGPKERDKWYNYVYRNDVGTFTVITKALEDRLYKHAMAKYGRGGKVGMCYPDGLIRTAKVLGLDVTVYFDPSCGLRCLTGTCGIWDQGLIQNQLDWCEDNGITVVYQKYDLHNVGPNDRIMKCLSPLHCLSLHWVMIRPDGTVMDPHQGRDYETLNKIKRRFFYNGTGLTLVFRRKSDEQKTQIEGRNQNPRIISTVTSMTGSMSSNMSDDTLISPSPVSPTDSD